MSIDRRIQKISIKKMRSPDEIEPAITFVGETSREFEEPFIKIKISALDNDNVMVPSFFFLSHTRPTTHTYKSTRSGIRTLMQGDPIIVQLICISPTNITRKQTNLYE